LTKKKPTKKEIEVVLSNVIRQVEFLSRKTYEISQTFGLYLDWKKDTDKFSKFVENEVKKAHDKLDEVDGPGESK